MMKKAIAKDGTCVYKLLLGKACPNRIVGGGCMGRCYRTRGDVNNIDDNKLLTPGNVSGKPVFAIPYLGYISVCVRILRQRYRPFVEFSHSGHRS
jgi:hypothetical protein